MKQGLWDTDEIMPSGDSDEIVPVDHVDEIVPICDVDCMGPVGHTGLASSLGRYIFEKTLRRQFDTNGHCTRNSDQESAGKISRISHALRDTYSYSSVANARAALYCLSSHDAESSSQFTLALRRSEPVWKSYLISDVHR